MDPIVINIMDLTQGITQTDLSTPLLVATDKAYDLKLISSLEELDGLEKTDNLYKMAASLLSQRPQDVYVLGLASAASGSVVVDAINKADIPHYYLATDLRTAEKRAPVAKAYGAKIGFYVAAGGLEETADVLVTEAKTLNTEGTMIMAHKGVRSEDVFADCAMIGKMAPVLEGTAPFYYQSLDGIPDGGYSKADVSKLQAGNVNTVTTYMKRIETWTGKTTKGSYCHFKVLKDWLQVRLKEALAKVIHNDKGVFMSEEGLGAITAAMKEVLDVGKTGRGVIYDYTVYTPLRSEIPANDRANGIVNGFQIQVTFTGFVEKVVVNIVAEV